MELLTRLKSPWHIAFSLRLSLAINVTVVASMLAIAIRSSSLALLSSVIENVIDLVVQSLLWWSGVNSRKVDYTQYPAGKSRYEAVSVIIAASLMGISAVIMVQESVTKLVKGFADGDIESPHMSVAALAIASVIIVTKFFLYLYCKEVGKLHHSSAVSAIAQDNRNDVISNSFAVLAFAISASYSSLWYLDACGAIAIFIFIGISWGFTAREQVLQLVGVAADDDFISEVKRMAEMHHPAMSPDIIRAYHFGSKYLVELEVILPSDMTVKEAHDIALLLQFKLEQLDQVERAFVHVDYQRRDYDEHVVSREEDALLRYIGSPPSCSLQPSEMEGNAMSPKSAGLVNRLSLQKISIVSGEEDRNVQSLSQNASSAEIGSQPQSPTSAFCPMALS